MITYIYKLMKKCFSQLIDRLTWDDEQGYSLSQKQLECMSCSQFQKCYAISMGKTIGRILVQLELLQSTPDEDDNGENGNAYIVDGEED